MTTDDLLILKLFLFETYDTSNNLIIKKSNSEVIDIISLNNYFIFVGENNKLIITLNDENIYTFNNVYKIEEDDNEFIKIITEKEIFLMEWL